MQQLVLASTSPFRHQLLSRFTQNFICAAPNCDETPLANEHAKDTAQRLAQLKAQSLKTHYPNALIIGSDQVALLNHEQLGKPMTLDNARTMLLKLKGKSIDFYTALCLFNTQTGTLQTHCDHTKVYLRAYSDAQIERYLQREPDALRCAGAAKSEGLGGTLIEKIESSDPNALIGLPLFKLVEMLNNEGLELP